MEVIDIFYISIKWTTCNLRRIVIKWIT